jgi:DNA-directed RNA polymerase subunit M/transcription elongation factor TFIIS
VIFSVGRLLVPNEFNFFEPQQRMKKLQIPAGDPAGRIVCQQCGNTTNFVEVAENVLVTTYYMQNSDGSFTPEDNSTEIFGEVKFLCGKCGADLTRYHAHFLEMSF